MLRVVAVLAVVLGGPAFAQQAIVSMPSADTTPDGEVFVMHESQARPWGPGPYWNSTHFLTFGVGNGFELCATLFNIEAPVTDRPLVALGFKMFRPILKETLPTTELGVTFGMKAMISLVGQGVGHWIYSHLSGRLPVLRTRIAAGLSHATQQLFKVDKLVFIGSIEQPLFTEKFNVVAEWFSGEHDLGNFIAGFTFHPNHTWIFVAGFKIPTSGPEYGLNKHAFVFEVGAFWDVLKKNAEHH
jgi:hypothetical protein